MDESISKRFIKLVALPPRKRGVMFLIDALFIYMRVTTFFCFDAFRILLLWNEGEVGVGNHVLYTCIRLRLLLDSRLMLT